jgi:hypothetical protein
LIGVNPIVIQNNDIVILHLNDKERGSEQLAPHGELYGDDASTLHQDAPMSFSVKLVFTSSSSSLPSFLNTA